MHEPWHLKVLIYYMEVLLNIMFYAPMGRFQLELIYWFSFIFHRRSIQLLDGTTVENKDKTIN